MSAHGSTDAAHFFPLDHDFLSTGATA